MFRGFCRAFFVLSLVPGSFAYGESVLDGLVRQAPLIVPQPDGVVYLNAEAAALVSLGGNTPRLINTEGGVLKVNDGVLDTWNEDQELPFWRIELPKAGRYRVILNHATDIERESAAEISFAGTTRRSVSGAVESTGGWDIFASTNLGEVDLDAGETVVRYRPTFWTHPQWVVKIADIRLIPLDGLQQLSAEANAVLKKMGINAESDVAALRQQDEQLARKVDAEGKIVRNRDFATYNDYGQFLQFDQAENGRTSDIEMARKIAGRLDLLQQEKLRSLAKAGSVLETDRNSLSAYFAAESVLTEGATHSYPKLHFLPQTNALAMSRAKTLFPTGNFGSLREQPIDTSLPVVNIDLAPPADLAERKARFAARDTNAGIAALCHDLDAAIKPGVPGLEDFYRFHAAGRYREALDAYRAYFFAKLADPEKYGAATQNILDELARDQGKGQFLFRPNPVVLDYNLHGCAVTEFKDAVLVGQVGPPGSVCWAPPDMALPPGVTYGYGDAKPVAFWKSPDGIALERKHNFFRNITFLPADRSEYEQGGLFNVLLFSYVTTGNRDHLQLWSDYVDDWSMNARTDDENCPFSPRKASELESQQVRGLLTMFRIVLDEQPGFATALNSASLARLLLHLEDDYVPYVIRAKRAEQANWGMMGLCQNLHIARFLAEFRASDYVMRESWRLWNINCIQHNTLDGENIEAWDTGHQAVATEFANGSIPFVTLPPGTSELEKVRFWDALKFNMRDLLVHISPAGYFWPPEMEKVDAVHNDLSSRWLKPDAGGHFNIDRITGEKGAQQRIETILNGGKAGPDGLPPQSSDFAPYASMAYLRDSWQPDADDLILQDFRRRSQSEISHSVSAGGRGMFLLSAGRRAILAGMALIVDGKPDNCFYGQIRTGGKTEYCAEADNRVSSDRFYTSAEYDFAEATQDSPYARFRIYTSPAGACDPGIKLTTLDGQEDPSPVTTVIDHRHVFHLRGSGVWIVSDRIENRGGASHQYAQFVGVPARLPAEGFADRVRLLEAAKYPLIEKDAAQGRVRTATPELENVSACFVGPGGAVFGDKLAGGKTMELSKATALDILAQGKNRSGNPESKCNQLFGLAWKGAGSQSLVTVLYSRPPTEGITDPFANDLSTFERIQETGNRMGCHLMTPQEAEVWFESGPELVNSLTCGPVSADAEALFVTKRAGKISGLLLGARKLRIAGRDVAVTSPDGEFSIDAQNTFAETGVIRRGIGTVRISPEGDVFTNQARVSFSIPGQDTGDIEYRYTLDDSEPTLGSRLYDGPFTISDTTLLKVRPFRKGLAATPWIDNGTDSGITVSALFHKQAPLPPVATTGVLRWGLAYQYFEGPWPRLFTYAGIGGVLAPKSSGEVRSLLDPVETAALRQTDRAYAIRYTGYINVPSTNVYAFHAPDPLYESTMDAGYDLRVFIDGHEWLPTPALHSRNVWNIALQRGLHALSVAYVDYRWKTFRNDYWMQWQPEEMWQGTPRLDISAPDLACQPIPASWLTHIASREGLL